MFSPETFVSRFHEYGRIHGLFGKRDTIIMAAVSGGVDSMVLIDLLSRDHGVRLHVAHFNHRLRGAESDGDEELVRSVCLRRGIECHVGSAPTGSIAAEQGRGVQEVARELRYAFFRSVVKMTGAGSVATGHHADDNAETILFHLCRGAGILGMRGILPSSENDGLNLIRPLLFARRPEIEDFARHERLVFRTDSSNLKDDYTRNALRHRLFPLLAEIFGQSVVDTIVRSGEALAPAAEYMNEQVRRVLALCLSRTGEGGTEVGITELKRAHPALRSLCLLEAARLAGSNPAQVHVQDLMHLLDAESGTRRQLPNGCEALRDRDVIRFEARAETDSFVINIEPGRTYAVAGFRFSAEAAPVPTAVRSTDRSVEFVDAGAIGSRRLLLRSWQDGDSFVPLGMAGNKKLSDFFVDEKIPVDQKRRIPVLATDDGTVIWVCGLRIDDRFRITGATQRALRLELSSLMER
jgi:tRNA(Ile)-lysidine synthase